ncbi:MAG: AsnC family transcriptional regulator [Thaumarchaeota archaeon]|nr:AsnC family transcriptional regulator [Nitrososphaerota archaeon]
MVVARRHFPRCEISLSKTDWEIVRSMRKDPRNSYAAVAKELHLSTKTVKRRLAKMIDGKAVFAVWASNPKVFEGAILADLRVLYDNSEPRGELVQKIISQLDDYLYFVGLWDVLSVFLLIVPNVSKMQELVMWAKQQQGVKNARIDIQQERIQLWEKMSEHIEKRLAQLTNV